jgi:primosomal protein N''
MPADPRTFRRRMARFELAKARRLLAEGRDAFGLLGAKVEQLQHLTEAMTTLATNGESVKVLRLSYLAADLAADVSHLVDEAGQASARALMAAG